MKLHDRFEDALRAWHEARRAWVLAKAHYDKTYALALIASNARSEDKRQAEADVAAEPAWVAMGLAEIEDKALWTWVQQRLALTAPADTGKKDAA